MITPHVFKNKTIAVLGLGKSGRTVALALHRAGAHVMAWDDMPPAREEAADHGVNIHDLSHIDWTTVDELVLSPGIPHEYPAPHPIVAKAKSCGVTPISDIEVLCRAQPLAKYVGITGTNGKSTTTTLVGHILSSAGRKIQVGGNLGIPVMDFDALGEDGIYVLELSSYQLDITPSLHCHGAIFLNISPDHLDRHGGMHGYVEAKKKIFHHMTQKDHAFVSIDDEWSMQVCEDLQANNIPVTAFSVHKSMDGGLYIENNMVVDDRDGNARNILDVSGIATLKGRHNAQNIIAAYGLCTFLGVSDEVCSEAISTYPGLAHRQQLVARWQNMIFVNDSKATNAEAVVHALEAYKDSHILWLAGGRQKEGGIDSLASYFAPIDHAFFYGEAAESFAATTGDDLCVARCEDLKAALNAAIHNALAHSSKDFVILLSPACASFDQFRNFEERGEFFVQAVNEAIQCHDKERANG